VGYPPTDVLQMIGRAGRRGTDRVGFTMWPSAASYQRLKPFERERCESRLKQDPITMLGLVGKGYDKTLIYEFYDKSLRAFISRKGSRAVEDGVEELAQHLIKIGTMTKDWKLTPFGEVAKYFPQNGGIVVAKLIYEQKLNDQNLVRGAELLAAFSLASFKEVQRERSYKFPWNVGEIIADLKTFYPSTMFPELYDVPFGRDRDMGLMFKEFNPDAAAILRKWCLETPSWQDFSRWYVSEYFAVGDLMNVLYRVAAYLQSISQARLGSISQAAASLRMQILRDPLELTIGRA
jgi:hypothetical protein